MTAARVSGQASGAVVALVAEDQPIELARLRLVHLGHEVPVAIEGRLDRGVTKLHLDVLRMRPLRRPRRVDVVGKRASYVPGRCC